MQASVDDPFSNPDALELFLSGGGGFDLDMPDMSLLLGGGGSDMSLLLGGGGGTAPSPRHSRDADGSRGQEETAPPAFRCLDAHHPSSCTRCTPPPSSAEAARYELVGDPGARNGEKKLRSLLTRTAEWASSDARSAAAELVEESLPRLASSLRARTSSSLSKELLLALLTLWGYKSDLWVRRGNRPSRSAAPLAPGTAASSTSDAPAAWAAMHALLEPLSKASFDGVAGLLARAEAERCAESALAYARELPPLRIIVEHLRQKWMPATSNLLALTLVGSDGAALERCAACVAQIVATARRIFAGLEQGTLARLADPSCSPAKSLWLREMVEGQQAQLRIFEELAEFLGRPSAADDRSSTTVAVVQFFTLHITGTVGGFDARIGWVTRLAEQAGAAGAGPLVEHAESMMDAALPLRYFPPTELMDHATAT